MATYPEHIFQNHMIHHPLLQYQMLFPSLLMSLGAPPLAADDGDPMIDTEGHVNSMDYLRFSALANQLAITQINQVLMDIVKEPPGDELNALMEVQNKFMELIKNGFAQMIQKIAENKMSIDKNNEIMVKQETTLTSVQDIAVTGFLDNLSKITEINGSITDYTGQSLSNAQEIKGMLTTISANIENLHLAYDNRTMSPISCVPSEIRNSDWNMDNSTQASEDSAASNEILLQIQSNLQNLTQILDKFISAKMEAAEVERETLNSLRDYCKNASSEYPSFDLSNITQIVEQKLADNLREIQPHVQNLTQGLGKFDATLMDAKETLRGLQEAVGVNMNKSETDLENLKRLTEMGFANLQSKIESLSFMSLPSPTTQATSNCPEEFFPVGEECFYLSTEEPLTYEEARLECNTRNAHLADPMGVLEFMIILKDFNFNESTGVWLGAFEKRTQAVTESQSSPEPEWYWEPSGLLIDHGWNKGYPSKDIGTCLYFFSQGLQNGVCDVQRYFVCKSYPDGSDFRNSFPTDSEQQVTLF